MNWQAFKNYGFTGFFVVLFSSIAREWHRMKMPTTLEEVFWGLMSVLLCAAIGFLIIGPILGLVFGWQGQKTDKQ